jgi:hypothetical protein
MPLYFLLFDNIMLFLQFNFEYISMEIEKKLTFLLTFYNQFQEGFVIFVGFFDGMRFS